jgi:hypothetical protein
MGAVIMKENLECRIFESGKRFTYCVYENGTVTRTAKKSVKETKVKPYLKKGGGRNRAYLMVKVNYKEYKVKALVAKYFCYGYKKGISVICADGNQRNCKAENLILCTQKEVGEEYGHLSKSMPIVVKKDGEEKQYRSMRQAAKALFVSYQTVFNYMNGKSGKRSVLSDYEIRRVE